MNEEEWKKQKKKEKLGKKRTIFGILLLEWLQRFLDKGINDKNMKKLKLVIVFGLSVVLFSAGFTSFASTGKTHVNVKSKKQL